MLSLAFPALVFSVTVTKSQPSQQDKHDIRNQHWLERCAIVLAGYSLRDADHSTSIDLSSIWVDVSSVYSVITADNMTLEASITVQWAWGQRWVNAGPASLTLAQHWTSANLDKYMSDSEV